MKEVLPAIIAYGFNVMQLHRIVAVVESENTASAGLMQSLGFAHEGRHRDAELKNGQFISLDWYALLEH